MTEDELTDYYKKLFYPSSNDTKIDDFKSTN